jgi:selenocysteine lyase/cysteine desulfurase
MGIQKKEARLRMLKKRWQEALREVPNIVINTPDDDWRSCGIGNVGLQNIKPATLAKRLYNEFGIFTVAIDYANVKGCRITPNVFTTLDEIDRFVDAMKKLS